MLKTAPSVASHDIWFKLSAAARAAAVAFGVALTLAAPAHAQNADDDDDSTFEERLIRNLMGGLGAKSTMDGKGIEYRERSPLVVPRSADLPAPETVGRTPTGVANWPKDADEQAKLAARKQRRTTAEEDAKPLMPSELNKGRIAAKKRTEPMQPGDNQSPMLSPSQLGYTGGLMGMFGGGNKTETAPFTGEPTRETLTQPPAGYQTPSPNYAYGTGPRESLVAKEYNPVAGKYGD